MCGGFTLNSTTNAIFPLQDSNGLIECWWLTPVPFARWDPALIQPMPGTSGPAPRFGHTLVFDSDSAAFLLFGGKDAAFSMLNDCWFLNVSSGVSGDSGSATAYSMTYSWAPCMAQGPLLPSARYGHGASVFGGALYVLGGFSSDGLTGIVEEDDMWRLGDYAGNGSWAQIMPSSASPSGRAYFGFWRSGYQLYMQGGEGSGSVLQDTWVFNFYTQVFDEGEVAVT